MASRMYVRAAVRREGRSTATQAVPQTLGLHTAFKPLLSRSTTGEFNSPRNDLWTPPPHPSRIFSSRAAPHNQEI
eukprot:6793496-Pyramimonas_sp.AAC.1